MKLDTTDFKTMTTKIKHTFSLPVDEHYQYQGRVEVNGPLVELEDVDGDILEDLVEVNIRKPSLGIPVSVHIVAFGKSSIFTFSLSSFHKMRKDINISV